MPPRHRILAPAKINLTLEVMGLLSGGFHELDTVFAWLELADVLEWEAAASTSLEIEGDAHDVVADEDNLVLRALRLLESKTGRSLPLALRLHKCIPAGGGLGGGSSDAAALLYGVNRSHGLDISLPTLRELAAQLGADVAFCVTGGTARGRGRGESLQALPPPRPCRVILACPGFGCPTPEIYRRWDRSPSRVQPQSSAHMQERLERGEDWTDLLSNDLQAPAEDYRPELRALCRTLLEAGCQYTLLSGSGSTVLGFPPPGRSSQVMERLASQNRVGASGVTYRCTRLLGLRRPAFADLESL